MASTRAQEFFEFLLTGEEFAPFSGESFRVGRCLLFCFKFVIGLPQLAIAVSDFCHQDVEKQCHGPCKEELIFSEWCHGRLSGSAVSSSSAARGDEGLAPPSEAESRISVTVENPDCSSCFMKVVTASWDLTERERARCSKFGPSPASNWSRSM